MPPELPLIFGFIIVVTAIVMGTIGKIAKHSLQLKQRQMELKHAPTGAAPEVVQRLDDMEQRLRVLERIATDGNEGAQLARQIEQLRDSTPLQLDPLRDRTPV